MENRTTLFLCSVADKEQEEINFNKSARDEDEINKPEIIPKTATMPVADFPDTEVSSDRERMPATPEADFQTPTAVTRDERNGEVKTTFYSTQTDI